MALLPLAPGGDEHLPADALARPFVERVGDDADDLDVELRVGPVAPAEPLADRAGALEEVPRELLVDDRHSAAASGSASSNWLYLIRFAEVPTFENRDLHRLEVAGRQRVHERLHVLAVGRLVALDRHRAVPLVAAQNRHGGLAGRLHAGRRSQVLEQVTIELRAALVGVAVERRRELEGHEVVELDARIGGAQVLQAAHEKAGAEEQEEAERDLRGDQALAEEERPAGSRDGSDRVLQRGPRIGPAGAQRRQQAEDDAGQQGQREGETRESAGPAPPGSAAGCSPTG